MAASVTGWGRGVVDEYYHYWLKPPARVYLKHEDEAEWGHSYIRPKVLLETVPEEKKCDTCKNIKRIIDRDIKRGYIKIGWGKYPLPNNYPNSEVV
jgi:hypothetical protein